MSVRKNFALGLKQHLTFSHQSKMKTSGQKLTKNRISNFVFFFLVIKKLGNQHTKGASGQKIFTQFKNILSTLLHQGFFFVGVYYLLLWVRICFILKICHHTEFLSVLCASANFSLGSIYDINYLKINKQCLIT